jgi:hypothetical protein
MKISDNTLGALGIGGSLLEVVVMVVLFGAPILWHYNCITASQTARFMVIAVIANTVAYHTVSLMVKHATKEEDPAAKA